MRAHVAPLGLHSPAMVRIANALDSHAPPGVHITTSLKNADLIIIYVIGADAMSWVHEHLDLDRQHYAVVQCCFKTAGGALKDWCKFWRRAVAVWSYYDLGAYAETEGFVFHHAPLGLDPEFVNYNVLGEHTNRIITTGCVSGREAGAEPIEDVWEAATALGVSVTHVGPPSVVGLDNPAKWSNLISFCQPTDKQLAKLYGTSRWVAALRHAEGFELPAAEAIACGCRPICFNQPSMLRWYGNLARYVNDRSGDPIRLQREIGAHLMDTVLANVVTFHERAVARARFDWSRIVPPFWSSIIHRMAGAA